MLTPAILDFQCPVCRARQPLQNQCRRCRADLSLAIAVRKRIAYLLQQQAQLADSDLKQQAVIDEIRLLAPRLTVTVTP